MHFLGGRCYFGRDGFGGGDPFGLGGGGGPGFDDRFGRGGLGGGGDHCFGVDLRRRRRHGRRRRRLRRRLRHVRALGGGWDG